MTDLKIPTYENVLQAEDRLRCRIHRTPVLTNSYINTLTESSIYFKCENFQKTGAFKFRGALNAVLALS
ncbi:MAG: threonine/serine dehydratase, partial [Planctomycetota bacterium]